jgi:hypothetical protein
MPKNEDTIELRKFLEYYERGWLVAGEACIRLYELAASIEPEQLLAAIPEHLRRELREAASRPLIPRKDWFTIMGGTVRPQDVESYARHKKAQEDRQYEGLCRLHRYFSLS